MTGRIREVIADALIAIAVFVAAVWLLGRVLGMFLWLAGLFGMLLVVAVLLAVAGVVRGRR